MNKNLNIKIVCDDTKYLPTYANESDACMDLKVVVGDVKGRVIVPNQTKLFSTGIKVQVPENHVMLIFPRSSTGIKSKVRLANTVGVIDSGYRDEVMLALHNFGDQSQIIEDGQRVAQFLVIPRPKLNLEIVPDDEEFKSGNRGGGIGSTGKI